MIFFSNLFGISSTHSRHVKFLPIFLVGLFLAILISLLLLSISVAYCVTTSTSCRMLFFICIGLVALCSFYGWAEVLVEFAG